MLRSRIESIHGPASIERLLSRGNVREVTAELANIKLPVAVMPADPEDPYHGGGGDGVVLEVLAAKLLDRVPTVVAVHLHAHGVPDDVVTAERVAMGSAAWRRRPLAA